MSKIKPIGSEKLQGIEKLQRIMEIARYKEAIPNSINETSSIDYRITLADGNTYEIVKERLGYIIKKQINESTSDYIDVIKNRKHQQIPLPKNELLMFANTPFKPECCPNTYSSSTGCACMTLEQNSYLIGRGSNNVPYSEY